MQNLWPLLLLLTLPAAAWAWHRFVLAEVALNAADILADGSRDTLRRGYHSRRSWARCWPWLALTLAAPAPLAGHWLAYALLAGAVGVALAGYFARWFTPLLNVARGLPEFQASHDSASWPDAAAWRQVRQQHFATDAAEQAAANALLRRTLTRTWRACLALAGVLAAGAVFTYFSTSINPL